MQSWLGGDRASVWTDCATTGTECLAFVELPPFSGATMEVTLKAGPTVFVWVDAIEFVVKLESL